MARLCRDQAFARFDGIIPWVAELAIPELTHFNDSYPQINDLTWTGHHLDRRFLRGLSRAAWDSIAAGMQSALTDSVIKEAVGRMPEPLRTAEGPELEHALQARRDELPWAAGEFYGLVTKYQDLHASDRPEVALVRRLPDGAVEVELFDRDPGSGGPAGSPFYARRFSYEESKEIRLLMHGGDDREETLTRRLQDELPYGIVVEVEGIGEAEDEPGKLVVQAVIWVERTGQKAIVIGKGGDVLKEVGRAARLELKQHFGRPVHLELWVKVREGWSDDENALRKFGYES